MNVPIQVRINATTVALERVSIRARVSGFLKERLLDPGANVRKGQLLFVIDERPFQADLDTNTVLLARAQSALAEAKQSNAREIAKQLLNVAEAQWQVTQIEEKRASAPLSRDAMCDVEVERRIALRIRAAAQVEVARIGLEKAEIDYKLDIHAAEARVAVAKSALRQSELNLGNCRIYSPIDGRAGEAKVQPGDPVGPSARSQTLSELTTVQQLDPMGVDIPLESRFLSRIASLCQQGLSVKIEQPGIGGAQVCPDTGAVVFIDNAVNPNTSTVLVKASVANSKHALLPGESVSVSITLDEVQDAAVVPEQAVFDSGAESKVYAVNTEGIVQIVAVKASLHYAGMRVIESGLQIGQVIMVDGFQLVRDGVKVRTEHTMPTTWARAVALTSSADPASALPPTRALVHNGEPKDASLKPRAASREFESADRR